MANGQRHLLNDYIGFPAGLPNAIAPLGNEARGYLNEHLRFQNEFTCLGRELSDKRNEIFHTGSEISHLGNGHWDKLK